MSFRTEAPSAAVQSSAGRPAGCRACATLLNPFHRRIPDKLMDLQRHASRDSVRKHPFRQFARIQQATGRVADTGGLLAESGREQHRIYPIVEMVSRHKVAGKLVVSAIT